MLRSARGDAEGGSLGGRFGRVSFCGVGGSSNKDGRATSSQGTQTCLGVDRCLGGAGSWEPEVVGSPTSEARRGKWVKDLGTGDCWEEESPVHSEAAGANIERVAGVARLSSLEISRFRA